MKNDLTPTLFAMCDGDFYDSLVESVKGPECGRGTMGNRSAWSTPKACCSQFRSPSSRDIHGMKNAGQANLP
jgi:hypothetical protein